PLLGITVLHISELLQRQQQYLRLHGPAGRKIAYHDPCALARFAPCIEAPRALVRAVNGTGPLEIGTWSRDLANCSGECGGVPFTHPFLSRSAAARRMREAAEAGAELIVTASPAAAIALRGGDLEVRELAEFIAEALP